MSDTHQYALRIGGEQHPDWYALFEDQNFANWLREHHIQLPLFEYRDGIYRLLVRTPLFPEHPLPPGFWYKGGCARALFFQQLGIPTDTPRDIDLIRHTDVSLNHHQEQSIVQKSDGIEHVGITDDDSDDESLEQYFSTRDFTINKVLANDREILFTADAFRDVTTHAIHLTEHQLRRIDRSNSDWIMMAAKSLRFELELSHHTPQSPWIISSEIFDQLTQDIVDQNPFYIL